MEFDRSALNRLLSLNDMQLKYIINRFVAEYGIDLKGYNVTEGDIGSVRRALENLGDAELSALSEQIKGKGRR